MVENNNYTICKRKRIIENIHTYMLIDRKHSETFCYYSSPVNSLVLSGYINELEYIDPQNTFSKNFHLWYTDIDTFHELLLKMNKPNKNNKNLRIYFDMGISDYKKGTSNPYCWIDYFQIWIGKHKRFCSRNYLLGEYYKHNGYLNTDIVNRVLEAMDKGDYTLKRNMLDTFTAIVKIA